MFLNPFIKHLCKGLLILNLRIKEDSENIYEPDLPYRVEKNSSNIFVAKTPGKSPRQTVQLFELYVATENTPLSYQVHLKNLLLYCVAYKK